MAKKKISPDFSSYFSDSKSEKVNIYDLVKL